MDQSSPAFEATPRVCRHGSLGVTPLASLHGSTECPCQHPECDDCPGVHTQVLKEYSSAVSQRCLPLAQTLSKLHLSCPHPLAPHPWPSAPSANMSSAKTASRRAITPSHATWSVQSALVTRSVLSATSRPNGADGGCEMLMTRSVGSGRKNGPN